MTRLLALLALALTARAVGAQAFSGPGSDSLATPYAQWWANVQHCTEDARPLGEAVSEVVVFDQPFFPDPDGQHAGAIYHADTREIWVARPYALDSVVVQHEMLHAVLEARHIRGHPAQYFGPQSPCRLPVTVAER